MWSDLLGAVPLTLAFAKQIIIKTGLPQPANHPTLLRPPVPSPPPPLNAMDLVLSVCNDLFLDKVWAQLVPLSAFANVSSLNPLYAENINASTSLPYQAASTWSHLVSSLPHPPLPVISLSSHPSVDVSAVSAWPREYIPRQLISLVTLTTIGIYTLYFVFAGISYYFFFNHDMMKHPRFIKGQVKMEIHHSLMALPGITLLTLPWFQAEVMGYSKLYDDVGEYGWGYLVFSMFL